MEKELDKLLLKQKEKHQGITAELDILMEEEDTKNTRSMLKLKTMNNELNKYIRQCEVF